MGILVENLETISMKTLFVCADRCRNNHAGEDYDAIQYVANQPEQSTIQPHADAIRKSIQELWDLQKGGEIDPKVVCYLDGPSPYHLILKNLQIIMKSDGVVIELPYEKPAPEITDRETVELLSGFNKSAFQGK